ncbi:hypothetical protein GMOD_00000434 [Pyrenophora seminiperda CCB06]|uniref:Uncharacterized protein n=1 Tax=Pyrenophora seminiperda CCB06 TaxID=1302712 RepID=A0A3M7M7A2_9PLEO|nr:hypothetical protein GMOD_00000434 [Pyrenophora seminiperda CCB06]
MTLDADQKAGCGPDGCVTLDHLEAFDLFIEGANAISLHVLRVRPRHRCQFCHRVRDQNRRAKGNQPSNFVLFSNKR